MNGYTHKDNKLFQPLTIANGEIHLRHRVIYAPMTRLRGLPVVDTNQNGSKVPTAYYPDELHAQYYSQRANEGGLLISEGIPPSVQGSSLPLVPGLFLAEQIAGWKKVTDAVHAKKGHIYAQIWHGGRVTIPQYIGGQQPVSSSAEVWGADDPYPFPTPDGVMVKYKDYPPQKLDGPGIQRVIGECVQVPRNAMEAGFDGIEIHGANGSLPEQFLASNINTRDDEYGGSPEKRPKFILDLLAALSAAIGSYNIGIRLSPFGLCHQMRSTHRLETWSALCRGIKERSDIGPLSYVHFIEPRWEQLHSLEDKERFLDSLSKTDDCDGEITLAPFRMILGDTPVLSGGGWNPDNRWDVVQDGRVDALANPHFVERLREGKRMNMYDRKLFYTGREQGYVNYPTYEAKKKETKCWGEVPDQMDPGELLEEV